MNKSNEHVLVKIYFLKIVERKLIWMLTLANMISIVEFFVLLLQNGSSH